MQEMSAQFDVVAVGDSTQDIFLKMHDASLQCDMDGENCKLCFDYADKIAVEKKTDVPAVGNAANNAIGISRMGLRSAIYTVVGNDDQGHKVKEVFADNGVDTRFVVLDEKNGTNLSIVVNYKSERTIFVYHEPRTYELPNIGEPKMIYLTSASGDGVKALHQDATRYLADHADVQLAFNPGTHQLHLGKNELLPLLQRTDWLFLNRQESAELLEMDSGDVRALVNGFHDIGVKNMVLTDGPEGSYVSNGSDMWYLGIFDGPVIERTGAGDSYGSGFLSAILKGKDIPEAMLWGNANSTSVVQYIGAREGLLTPDAAEHMISENPSIRPEEYGG